MNPPQIADAILAVIVGAAVALFSLSTLADPYWSRTTRGAAFLGLIAGAAAFLLGLAALLDL